MNMHKLLKSKRRGSVIPLAMLAVAMLLIVGTGLLTLGFNSRTFSARTASQIAARSAADAGLTKALYEMNQKLNVKPWDGDSLPLAANQTLPNCCSFLNYTITGDIVNGYTIESVGKSNHAEQSVKCTLKLKGPFEYAIFAIQGLELKNSAVVDWYNFEDDDVAMKVATNSTASSAITLKNSATINGDVIVGAGGDPDDVIELKNSATITGETSAMPAEQELPPIIVPQWLQSMTLRETIESGDDIYPSGKYEGIDLSTGSELYILENVTFYITGDVTLRNSAKIIVEENASLVLYVGGKIEGKNGSAFNNEAQDPKKLKIFGLDGCDQMSFKNGSEFYGVIYAPNADVTFHNSADAYGSIIVKNFEQKNSATFHYDASLRKNVSIDDPAIAFEVSNWNEN